LTGLAATDWTWSPKFADFDNDGWVDLFIANGMSRDFLNADLLSRMRERGHPGWRDLPQLREANLAFRNRGDLRFEEVGRSWGLDAITASYAAAVADLDRDGDLDLVVGNLGEPVSVYRNDSAGGHRCLLRLRGRRSNSWGIQATVNLQTQNGIQTRYLGLASGFMSANEPLVHFGLGDSSRIERLTIQWPSGLQQEFRDLEADRLYTVTEPDVTPTSQPSLPPPAPMFHQSSLVKGIRHRERPLDDFQREPLLPWKLSQLGPGLAVGDVNGDNLEDLYLGGAAGFPGLLCLREPRGGFRPSNQSAFESDQACEDMGVLFFDADGDGDLDLYVVSGGVEGGPADPCMRDRLYRNDGHGNFRKAAEPDLPDLRHSGSVAAAADFDRDGDLDLMVGGRCVPGRYPSPADSCLLRNQGGVFTNVTQTLAPELEKTGLATAAVWSDVNNDGWIDLLITHEWGPVKELMNEQGRLVDRTREAGLADLRGWWNSLAPGDLDHDGDMDFVVGNLGLNTRYTATGEQPILGWLGEFDDSGRSHFIEAIVENGRGYPLRSLNALAAALPSLRQRFPSAQAFAEATLAEALTPARLGAAQRYVVNTLDSGVLLNDGRGRFVFRPLPRLAQVAPIFGLALTDVDADGHLDLVVAQNFFSPQPETGRMDGGLGLLLRGNGDGSFTPLWPLASGLVIPGDAKSLAITDLNRDGQPDVLVGINDDELMAFENQGASGANRLRIKLRGRPGNPTGIGARIQVTPTTGLSHVAELCAGSGYLSQSTAELLLGLGAAAPPFRIEVRWARGTTTTRSLESPSPSVEIAE
jgi:hypothetical protein